MPDPTIRTCWGCDKKRKMFYGELLCSACKQKGLIE